MMNREVHLRNLALEAGCLLLLLFSSSGLLMAQYDQVRLERVRRSASVMLGMRSSFYGIRSGACGFRAVDCRPDCDAI